MASLSRLTPNAPRFQIVAGTRDGSAEGVGFEPTEPVTRLNSFQDCRLRPLGHPSNTDPKTRPAGHWSLTGDCDAEGAFVCTPPSSDRNPELFGSVTPVG